MDEVRTDQVRLRRDALSWRFSRSGGPGGQGVNTTDSQVELIADLTRLEGDAVVVERVRDRLGEVLVLRSSTERSQLANRREVLTRLEAQLSEASVPPKTRKARRTPRWVKEKRLETKRRTSEKKAARRSW